MIPDPQYVLAVAAELQSAKAAVDKWQKIWDAFFPDPPASPAEGLRENSAISRTLEFLNSQAPHEYGSAAIAKALSLPVASTRTNLAKLFKQGKVNKRGDGLYRALEVSEEDAQ